MGVPGVATVIIHTLAPPATQFGSELTREQIDQQTPLLKNTNVKPVLITPFTSLRDIAPGNTIPTLVLHGVVVFQGGIPQGTGTGTTGTGTTGGTGNETGTGTTGGTDTGTGCPPVEHLDLFLVCQKDIG